MMEKISWRKMNDVDGSGSFIMSKEEILEDLKKKKKMKWI
jgi:hypothetical protein